MKKVYIIFTSLIMVFIVAGCSLNDSTEYSKDIYAMDTYMTVTAYGKNGQEAVGAAEEEINRLDKLFSTENEEGELYQLNESKSATMSKDCLEVLDVALDLWQKTGTFDVAIYPVVKLWGFTGEREDLHVPEEEALSDALKHIDPSLISVDEASGFVTLGDDEMSIDFGGIAKGYTSSKIMEIFDEYEVKSGIVSLGGNVQVKGLKPNGDKWKVAIENPDSTEDYLGVYSACDGDAVITSGGYERNFTEDGVTYHHILDPSTGYPAENGLESVTIISKDGTYADGLSTAIFIMGTDKAIEFYKKSTISFDMVLLTDQGKLYITQGIKDDFSSEFDYEIISK